MEVGERLPDGIVPILGPVSTALERGVSVHAGAAEDDGERALTKDELVQRRTIQDWVARPLLRSIPGVAEINSTGGYVKQYQVLVDPYRLRGYGLTIQDTYNALAAQ